MKITTTFLILFFSGLTIAQDQNISNGAVFEGEPFLAVNPTNTNNVVVAWMGYVFVNGTRLSIKIKSSFDGGITWGATVTMPHIVSTYKSADPSMGFDANGNLFLAYIDYRESPDSGGVYLFKSTNGGVSWGSPTLILDMYADGNKLPIDRPWLSVNEAGTNLYLTSKPPSWVPAPNRPYFIASTDGGLNWNPWRYIDSTGYLVGDLIQAPMASPVCMGNQFHAIYPSYLTSQNVFPQLIHASSTSNGADFEYHSVMSGATVASNDTAKLGGKLIQNPADINHLVYVFPFAPYGDIDILMTESFNAGVTWSTWQRVNDDAIGNGKMQEMMWADFDADGDLVISWRDRRNSPGIGFMHPSDYYAAFRDKDSSDFEANFRLNDSLVAYNSILESSGNDFMGIELNNDTIAAVWSNTRDGSLDVWFVKRSVASGLATISLIESESFELSVFPNPVGNTLSIFLTDHAVMDQIVLLDLSGNMLLKQSPGKDSVEMDLSAFNSGVYVLQVWSKGHVFTQKILRK